MNLRLLSLLAIAVPSMALAAQNLLSPRSYGKIKFGAKLSEVEATLKERAKPQKRDPGCDFVHFNAYPSIRFMVEEGVVTRADAGSHIRNSSGIKEGMSLARAKQLHPQIQVEPHKYDDSGHYLILPTSDGQAALVFEEGGGKITDVRAGLQPSVQYVEGCS